MCIQSSAVLHQVGQNFAEFSHKPLFFGLISFSTRTTALLKATYDFSTCWFGTNVSFFCSLVLHFMHKETGVLFSGTE